MTYSAGKHWSALGVPVAEPYQPPTDRHPGGWSKTGTAGAKETMAVDATEATEAQTAAFQAVDDAFRRNLTAYAKAVHDTLEAATRRPDPTTITPELRRTLIARAIGWFRR